MDPDIRQAAAGTQDHLAQGSRRPEQAFIAGKTDFHPVRTDAEPILLLSKEGSGNQAEPVDPFLQAAVKGNEIPGFATSRRGPGSLQDFEITGLREKDHRIIPPSEDSWLRSE